MLNEAKRVLKEESEAIKNLANNIDNNFVEAIDLINKTKGKVIVTGIGKSGIIGKKISATLSSIGVPSFFVHSLELLHGELGVIDASDVIIVISNSGNSKEIKEAIKSIKNRDVPIIAITSNKNSYLAKNANIILNTLVKKEACPLNLAPTTSTTVTLALGDAIAMTLLKCRQIKEKDYALNHPDGSLGKRLTLKVEHIMRKEPKIPINNEKDSLTDVISEMTSKLLNVSCITDSYNKLRGIITDGDLRRFLQKGGDINKDIKEVINYKSKTISKDTLAIDALKLMKDNNINVLIVIDRENKLEGVLHKEDILREGLK